MRLDIFNRLGVAHECDSDRHTDGRTNKTTVSNSAVYRPALIKFSIACRIVMSVR